MGTTATMDRVPAEREERVRTNALRTPAGLERYPAFGWVWVMPATMALMVLINAYISLSAR